MISPSLQTQIDINLLEKLRDGLASLREELKYKDACIKTIAVSHDRLAKSFIDEKRSYKKQIALLKAALISMTLATTVFAYKYFSLLYKNQS